MLEISDNPRTRNELQAELRIGLDAILWLRKQFYIYLDDCGHMEKGHPLEPYLVWLFRKIAKQPAFQLKGKTGGFQLNRRLIVIELNDHPQKYTKAKFWEETHQHEQTRVIDCNWAYIRQV